METKRNSKPRKTMKLEDENGTLPPEKYNHYSLLEAGWEQGL